MTGHVFDSISVLRAYSSAWICCFKQPFIAPNFGQICLPTAEKDQFAVSGSYQQGPQEPTGPSTADTSDPYNISIFSYNISTSLLLLAS